MIHTCLQARSDSRLATVSPHHWSGSFERGRITEPVAATSRDARVGSAAEVGLSVSRGNRRVLS